jgi:glycosyltransferase involved in cell wall biosynthesis
MRVALISPLFESVPPRLYGGTERVVYNLCRGLTEADIEVTVFASGDSSVEGSIAPVIGEALRLSKKEILDPNTYNFKMLSMVADRASEFDVIHNHHDYWMLPLSKMTSTPLLNTLHGRLDLPDLPAAFYSYPNTSYISISDAQRAPLSKLRWLRTIYHGLDLESFPFYEKPGKYLVFLGRMDPTKGVDRAIEIAKLSGVPLKIAAKIEGRVMEEYFAAKIKPHLDGKFIEFVGEISDCEKVDFLGNALGVCFPIDWPEPFGLVPIEALACGTPVLARPCGSVPEILCDGITGYSDPDIRVLASRVKDLAKLNRRKCREWVEHRFSLRRMTEEYIHVYRHLIEFASARSKESAPYRYRRDFLHPVERIADGNS